MADEQTSAQQQARDVMAKYLLEELGITRQYLDDLVTKMVTAQVARYVTGNGFQTHLRNAIEHSLWNAPGASLTVAKTISEILEARVGAAFDEAFEVVIRRKAVPPTPEGGPANDGALRGDAEEPTRLQPRHLRSVQARQPCELLEDRRGRRR